MSKQIPEGWSLRPIGELIKESRLPIENDDPAKRLTVRLHLKGVEKRQERVTDGVGPTIYFKRRKGQFVYGKQSLHRGGLGVISDVYDGFASSQDIPTFDFNESCDQRWFIQFFMQSHFYKGLERIASGTGAKRIQPKDLFRIEIPCPPLPEQEKIASILVSIDKVIQNIQKQVRKLQDLKKSVINELLTKGIGHTVFKDSKLGRIPNSWETILLCSLGRFFGGLTGKSSKDFGKGEPFLTYTQVFLQKVCNKQFVNFVNIEDDEKQHRVRFGDILFTASSETPAEVGMTAVFLDKDWSPYLNSFCFGFRPKTFVTIDPYFAKYLFRGERFRNDIRPLAQGITRFNLSKENLKKLHLLIPPLIEQRKIASILTSIDDEIEEVDKKIGKLQFLKKALMQDLLTGKVRVKID